MGRAIVLSGNLTAANKQAIAESMCVYAASLIRGDTQEPATWRAGLRRLGCAVSAIWEADADVAYFTPGNFSNRYPLGVVSFNPRQDRLMRARGLAHEFGHALCFQWVPHFVFDSEIVYLYYDDPRDTRHQIARLFERMMVG
jgi:hypothetical protein